MPRITIDYDPSLREEIDLKEYAGMLQDTVAHDLGLPTGGVSVFPYVYDAAARSEHRAEITGYMGVQYAGVYRPQYGPDNAPLGYSRTHLDIMHGGLLVATQQLQAMRGVVGRFLVTTVVENWNVQTVDRNSAI